MSSAPPTAPVCAVVCTYSDDRLEDLLAAVGSIRAQEPNPEETVVVVDHNEALQARLAALLEGVTILANTEAQGLSGARNTAVAHARSAIVAFLDDDATAAPGWVAGIASAYDDPEVIGAGGLVRPRWPEGQPSWFPEEFGWVVGCSYRGQPVKAAPVRNLIGCNMSVRRDVFERVGGFSAEVGRIGLVPTGCEETEFYIRATQSFPASRIIYDPQVAVDHRVTPQRARVAYFLHRCWSEGKSKAVVARLAGASDGLSTERSYSTRVLPQGVLRNLARLGRGETAGLARAALIVTGFVLTGAGYVVASARQRSTGPATSPAPTGPAQPSAG